MIEKFLGGLSSPRAKLCALLLAASHTVHCGAIVTNTSSPLDAGQDEVTANEDAAEQKDTALTDVPAAESAFPIGTCPLGNDRVRAHQFPVEPNVSIPESVSRGASVAFVVDQIEHNCNDYFTAIPGVRCVPLPEPSFDHQFNCTGIPARVVVHLATGDVSFTTEAVYAGHAESLPAIFVGTPLSDGSVGIQGFLNAMPGGPDTIELSNITATVEVAGLRFRDSSPFTIDTIVPTVSFSDVNCNANGGNVHCRFTMNASELVTYNVIPFNTDEGSTLYNASILAEGEARSGVQTLGMTVPFIQRTTPFRVDLGARDLVGNIITPITYTCNNTGPCEQ